MVSSLVAGTDFGMVLLWAVILGAILKYFLTEGIGRWYMASGQTILQGWRSLGRWAIWYFVIYLFIVTFVFGAAVTSTAALAVDAALPGVLPLWAWAALHSVAAFIIVGIGRYGLFEMIMKTFAALKFGIVILLAILLAPALGEVVLGFVPRIPEGALINVLAIIGGVGGTYSLAAYTYWVRERGWRHSDWIPTMRTDLGFGYALTALFMVSMLIIGAELLFGTGTSISDEEGLLALVDPMQDRFGLLARWAFLIGFWAVATGAMLGAWNGGAYLFADCVRTIREAPDEEASDYLSEKSIFFRGFLAWMSFPPMILLAFGEPVLLVIVYASLGAHFLPFLAITLLILLNSQRVTPEYRNRLVSNVVLAVSVIPFIVVGVQEVLGSL
jgi:Mn2+/Fe2+ NRAMP family transporter